MQSLCKNNLFFAKLARLELQSLTTLSDDDLCVQYIAYSLELLTAL